MARQVTPYSKQNGSNPGDVYSFLNVHAYNHLETAIGRDRGHTHVIVDLRPESGYIGPLPGEIYAFPSSQLDLHAKAIREGPESKAFKNFETKLGAHILHGPNGGRNEQTARQDVVEQYLGLLQGIYRLPAKSVELLKERLGVRVKLAQDYAMGPEDRVFLDGIVKRHPGWEANLNAYLDQIVENQG